MWNKIKNIAFIIAIILLAVVFFKKKEKDIIRTRIVMEIPIEGKFGTFAPKEFPKPKKEKSKPKLIKQFKESTKEQQDSLYADAVTERSYEEIFKDSTQSITVTSNVQGKLLNQSLEYEIYPYTVKIDTTVYTPIERRYKLFVYGNVGLPTKPGESVTPSVEGGFMIQNKKDNLIILGFDSNAYIKVGYAHKLKFK